MDRGIAGKVAFVEGGSMGRGRARAELFAREGCRVVIAALREHEDTIKETVEAIRSEGGQAAGVAADLTVEEDVERAIAFATDTFGPPDIAVANVGGPGPGYFDDVSNDDFTASGQRMAMSMVYLARAVLPHMREPTWGRIVILNSNAAKEPPPERAHILPTTTRAAVVPLSKSLANEFGPDGITVNTIGTGYIGTPRMRRYYEPLSPQRAVPLDNLLPHL